MGLISEDSTDCRGYQNAELGDDGIWRISTSFSQRDAFELIEIPAGKRGKNADIKRILEQEGKRC